VGVNREIRKHRRQYDDCPHARGGEPFLPKNLNT